MSSSITLSSIILLILLIAISHPAIAESEDISANILKQRDDKVDGLHEILDRLSRFSDSLFNFISLPANETDTKFSRPSAWIWSAGASIAVALTGVIPAVFLPDGAGSVIKELHNEKKLNRLLSFAVGSLLGDVFLHILPETWKYASFSNEARHWGSWVIFGAVLCFLVEKCCANSNEQKNRAAAFVNLFANAVDNFTHGLAVGGSFLVSIKFGLLTTFAILIHEIPHEISDFAILLRADFDRWSAIKAQLVTASGGLLGASVALFANSGINSIEQAAACWILPFTAGGFINVALVQVLPDLLKESSPTENARQILYILSGVVLMGLISAMHF